MAPRLALIILLLAAVLAAETSTAFDTTDRWEIVRPGADGELIGADSSSDACDGLVGKCGGEDGELDLNSAEETRRFLYGASGRQKFISYGALNKNRIPCNRRGQSYYNCQRSQKANPYRRACTVITRCARDLS